MSGMFGVLELLKQSRPGELQRVELLLERSLFGGRRSSGNSLLARFLILDLIGDRLAFPPTSHNRTVLLEQLYQRSPSGVAFLLAFSSRIPFSRALVPVLAIV